MARETVLKLNRGASYNPINLNGSVCKIRGPWAPRVAKRRTSQHGGIPFEDVTENIPLRIDAPTAALALEKLEDILAALEQARAVQMGAGGEPVLLEYKPHGSSLTDPAQAAVLATPLNEEDYLSLLPSFDTLLQAFSIEFNLPLKRRGEWLGAAETPAASSSVANPGAMTVTFANSVRIPSPVKLVFNETPAATNAPVSGFVFVADVADKIVMVEAEGIPTAAGVWIEPAGNASGGAFKRYLGTGGSIVTVSSSIAINSNARLFALYMNARNGSLGNYEYIVQLDLLTAGTLNVSSTGPKEVTAGVATVLFMGLIALPDTPTTLKLHVTASGSGSVNNGLEIDNFFILAKDEFTKSIGFDARVIGLSPIAAFSDLVIDPAWLTHPEPYIKAYDATPNARFLDRTGDMHILSQGTNLTVWLAGGINNATDFYMMDAATAGTRLSFDVTATRQRGYLVVR